MSPLDLELSEPEFFSEFNRQYAALIEDIAKSKDKSPTSVEIKDLMHRRDLLYKEWEKIYERNRSIFGKASLQIDRSDDAHYQELQRKCYATTLSAMSRIHHIDAEISKLESIDSLKDKAITAGNNLATAEADNDLYISAMVAHQNLYARLKEIPANSPNKASAIEAANRVNAQIQEYEKCHMIDSPYYAEADYVWHKAVDARVAKGVSEPLPGEHDFGKKEVTITASILDDVKTCVANYAPGNWPAQATNISNKSFIEGPAALSFEQSINYASATSPLSTGVSSTAAVLLAALTKYDPKASHIATLGSLLDLSASLQPREEVQKSTEQQLSSLVMNLYASLPIAGTSPEQQQFGKTLITTFVDGINKQLAGLHSNKDEARAHPP